MNSIKTSRTRAKTGLTFHCLPSAETRSFSLFSDRATRGRIFRQEQVSASVFCSCCYFLFMSSRIFASSREMHFAMRDIGKRDALTRPTRKFVARVSKKLQFSQDLSLTKHKRLEGSEPYGKAVITDKHTGLKLGTNLENCRALFVSNVFFSPSIIQTRLRHSNSTSPFTITAQ